MTEWRCPRCDGDKEGHKRVTVGTEDDGFSILLCPNAPLGDIMIPKRSQD
jgi:hypothetical protein